MDEIIREFKMAYESLGVLVPPVTIIGVALLKVWRDSARTREVAEDAHRLIQAHTAKCDEVPKALLIEKIENVSQKVEAAQEDAMEFRKVIRSEFERAADRLDNLTTIILNRPHP